MTTENIIPSHVQRATLSDTTTNLKGSLFQSLDTLKDRASRFITISKYKFREYQGKITETELQSLLEYEYEQYKVDSGTIPHVFDPKVELETVRKQPQTQKHEALAEFKDNLNIQRDAWATCQTFLERKVRANHDVGRDDLVVWIDKFTLDYGFTEDQRQLALEIVDDFYVTRQNVIDFRNQHPDNVELVNFLTRADIPPATEIDIRIGPASIDINCHSQVFLSFLKNSGQVTEPLPPATMQVYSIAGKEIAFVVNNLDNLAPGAMDHEHQHQENIFFEEKFKTTTTIEWGLYLEENDPKIKKVLLANILTNKRELALVRLKDELIAMKKDRTPYNYDILFKQDKSSYDYLKVKKNLEGNPDVRELTQRILVKEYRQIGENAIKAFDHLKKTGHHTVEKTIALLIDQPLSKWPKTVARLLGEDE